MNLRPKLTLYLLLLNGLLAIISSIILHQRVLLSYEQIEKEASRQDVQRLLRTIDSEFFQLDRLARDWATWDELYAYTTDLDPEFYSANIAPQQIAIPSLHWLALYDSRAQLLVQSGVHPETGKPHIYSEFGDTDLAMQTALHGPLGDNQDCGLGKTSLGAMMICRRPINDSSRQNIPRGVLVMGRLLDKEVQARIIAQTGLQFELKLNPAALPSNVLPTPTPFHSQLNEEATIHAQDEERYQMRKSLRDMVGRPVVELSLPWPRTIMARGREVLKQTQWQLLILTAFGAISVVLVIDQVVVNRLRRVHQKLNQISTSRNWAERTEDTGQDEIGELSEHTNSLLSVINTQVNELEQSALTDPLTHLCNRRAFDDKLDQAIRLQQRNQQIAGLLMLDVDFFKRYNDHYGHQAGDIALKKVALCLQGAAQRASESPCRLGGEEFAIILTNCSSESALLCAQRVQELLNGLAITHLHSDVAKVLTVSIGLAISNENDNPETLYARADAALYQAKAAGRNQIYQG